MAIESSGHWYRADGSACFQLPSKSKPGTTRGVTLRDARELGLLPSVTTILSVLSKGALEKWKMEQVAKACWRDLSKPMVDIPAEDTYVRGMIDNAFQQVDAAASLGTDIHDALEKHFQGRIDFASHLQVYVDAVDKWAKSEGIEFEKHELHLVNQAGGYAGTTDAIIRCKRGRGILDFKSRKTTAGKPCTPYDTQPIQIAAYHAAAGLMPLSFYHCGVNVFISTTEPGRVEATWYDHEQLERELEAFDAALTLWRHLRNFDPRFVS